MNFYLSISQLIQASEGLEKNLNLLAENAFRVIPRDSRTNREILEKAAAKVAEAKGCLEKEIHLSKTALRHAALLYQILALSFLRMIHLASALSKPERGDWAFTQTLLFLFSGAYRHFEMLKGNLTKLSTIAPSLEMEGTAEKPAGALDAFQQEEADRRELMAQLDKAVELFSEEQELIDTFHIVRQDLFEAKKAVRRFSASQAATKAALSQDLPQRQPVSQN
jgi:hypothetical protein